MPTPMAACLERPTAECLQALNLDSAIAGAREVVRLALAGACRPLLTTSFGPDSAVMLHLVTREAPSVPVVWVDTGFNTKATQAFASRLARELRLDLRIFRPARDWPGMVPAPGEPDHRAFTEQVKLEPFSRALAELRPDVWLSGLRREETAHRERQSHFNRSAKGLLKVHPLLHWTAADLAAYRARHGLADEPDYHDATKAGPRRECGLHLAF